MIIALCGTSAAGKSFLIKNLRKSELFSGKSVFIKKEDQFFLSDFLKRLGFRGLVSEYKDTVFFKKKPSMRQRIFSWFVPFVYPTIIYLEFLSDFVYYEVLFKDKILIRDRYIYDYIVTLKDVLGTYNRATAYFFERFFRPSLLFFLSINLETAIRRNKNNVKGKITASQDFHKRVINSYDSLAKRYDALLIDTNKSPDNSLREIEKHIKIRENLSMYKSFAIIGPDGSGKTTLIKLFSSYLKKLNLEYNIIHFYHENIVYKILKKFGYDDTESVPASVVYKRSRVHALKKRERGTPFLLALFRFTDSLIQYYSAVFLNRKSLIIFDRFFYDYLVSFEFLNVSKREIFKSWIPRVNKVFLLIADPAIAYKRKPENDLESFAETSGIYKKIARDYKIPFTDTTKKEPLEVLGLFLEKI